MEMYQNLGNFLDNYGSPFFVGSLVEKKVLFVNKIAKKIFGCTEETCDFGKIFERTEERLESLIEKGLKSGKNSLYYNFIAITGTQEKIVVDLQFGFFNEEKTQMFLEIMPQNDTRLQMAQHQIQHSPRAEAILNFDEKLSIVDCNEAFHKVFESSEELRHSHFKNDLVNGFLPEIRDSLMADIHKTLEISEIYSTEIKVFTATGEEKWYRFDLQKRDVGTTKLMCYMVNIEKEVQRKEENNLLNQYLSIIQESSTDILYRVDIKENTMYHYSDFIEVGGKERAIEDYVNVFMSDDIIHSEDKNTYLQCFKDFYEKDIQPNVPIRFSFDGEEYRWYRIAAKKLFDSKGDLVEVFGALLNVDSEVHLQEEVSTVNNYFEAFQSVSDESFCVINLEKKTLTQKGNVAKELGMTEVQQNFPDSTFSLIHPDDMTHFKAFSEESILGESIRTQTRMKTVHRDYQWYELRYQGITDKNGKVSEIVGKIKNIQKQKKMQEEVNTMHTYFDVLQEFSDDILYRVDAITKTLYHSYQRNLSVKLESEVPNYLETLLDKKIIHPDDAENFLAKTQEWYKDETVVCDVRLSLFDDDYMWYSVKRRKVFDKTGKLVEIIGALVKIQREKEMQADYSELNQFFTAMQELDNDVVFRIDLPTMTLSFKKQISADIWEEIEIPDFFQSFKEGNQLHPDDRERYFRLAGAYFNGSVSDSDFRCEVRLALVSQEYIWYNVKCKKIYNNDGFATEVYGKLLNIDTEKEITKGYSHLNQYFTAMQDLSDDILFHIDIKTMVFHHNDRKGNGIGCAYNIPDFVNTLIDKNIIHPDCHESYRNDIKEMLEGTKMQYNVLSLSKPDVYEWFKVQGRFIRNEHGKPIEVFGKMQNVQAQRNLEERAYHDMMTGALNKATFEEQCKSVLETATFKEKYALIFIDLDDFKSVNDTLGHSYGDALLSTVGKRLKRLVRGDDLVGRIGGDEFAVMLRNVDSDDSVLVRTNLMLESMRRDFSFEKKVVGIKASVGVAIYPKHGENYKDLIGNADIAVYDSKRRGKNVVSLYSREVEKS